MTTAAVLAESEAVLGARGCPRGYVSVGRGRRSRPRTG